MPILPVAYECEFRVMVEKIIAASALTDVSQYLFRLSQTHHTEARRVVWVPLGGQPNASAPQRGAEEVGDYMISFLADETLEVEARIVGIPNKVDGQDVDGFEDAERIRRNLLAAFRATCVAERREGEIGQHAWETQSTGAAGHLHGGAELVVQRFAFAVPVPREVIRKVTITAQSHTCTIDNTLTRT